MFIIPAKALRTCEQRWFQLTLEPTTVMSMEERTERFQRLLDMQRSILHVSSTANNKRLNQNYMNIIESSWEPDEVRNEHSNDSYTTCSTTDLLVTTISRSLASFVERTLFPIVSSSETLLFLLANQKGDASDGGNLSHHINACEFVNSTGKSTSGGGGGLGVESLISRRMAIRLVVPDARFGGIGGGGVGADELKSDGDHGGGPGKKCDVSGSTRAATHNQLCDTLLSFTVDVCMRIVVVCADKSSLLYGDTNNEEEKEEYTSTSREIEKSTDCQKNIRNRRRRNTRREAEHRLVIDVSLRNVEIVCDGTRSKDTTTDGRKRSASAAVAHPNDVYSSRVEKKTIFKAFGKREIKEADSYAGNTAEEEETASLVSLLALPETLPTIKSAILSDLGDDVSQKALKLILAFYMYSSPTAAVQEGISDSTPPNSTGADSYYSFLSPPSHRGRTPTQFTCPLTLACANADDEAAEVLLKTIQTALLHAPQMSSDTAIPMRASPHLRAGRNSLIVDSSSSFSSFSSSGSPLPPLSSNSDDASVMNTCGNPTNDSISASVLNQLPKRTQTIFKKSPFSIISYTNNTNNTFPFACVPPRFGSIAARIHHYRHHNHNRQRCLLALCILKRGLLSAIRSTAVNASLHCTAKDEDDNEKEVKKGKRTNDSGNGSLRGVSSRYSRILGLITKCVAEFELELELLLFDSPPFSSVSTLTGMMSDGCDTEYCDDDEDGKSSVGDHEKVEKRRTMKRRLNKEEKIKRSLVLHVPAETSAPLMLQQIAGELLERCLELHHCYSQRWQREQPRNDSSSPSSSAVLSLTSIQFLKNLLRSVIIETAGQQIEVLLDFYDASQRNAAIRHKCNITGTTANANSTAATTSAAPPDHQNVPSHEEQTQYVQRLHEVISQKIKQTPPERQEELRASMDLISLFLRGNRRGDEQETKRRNDDGGSGEEEEEKASCEIESKLIRVLSTTASSGFVDSLFSSSVSYSSSSSFVEDLFFRLLSDALEAAGHFDHHASESIEVKSKGEEKGEMPFPARKKRLNSQTNGDISRAIHRTVIEACDIFTATKGEGCEINDDNDGFKKKNSSSNSARVEKRRCREFMRGEDQYDRGDFVRGCIGEACCTVQIPNHRYSYTSRDSSFSDLQRGPSSFSYEASHSTLIHLAVANSHYALLVEIMRWVRSNDNISIQKTDPFLDSYDGDFLTPLGLALILEDEKAQALLLFAHAHPEDISYHDDDDENEEKERITHFHSSLLKPFRVRTCSNNTCELEETKKRRQRQRKKDFRRKFDSGYDDDRDEEQSNWKWITPLEYVRESVMRKIRNNNETRRRPGLVESDSTTTNSAQRSFGRDGANSSSGPSFYFPSPLHSALLDAFNPAWMSLCGAAIEKYYYHHQTKKNGERKVASGCHSCSFCSATDFEAAGLKSSANVNTTDAEAESAKSAGSSLCPCPWWLCCPEHYIDPELITPILSEGNNVVPCHPLIFVNHWTWRSCLRLMKTLTTATTNATTTTAALLPLSGMYISSSSAAAAPKAPPLESDSTKSQPIRQNGKLNERETQTTGAPAKPTTTSSTTTKTTTSFESLLERIVVKYVWLTNKAPPHATKDGLHPKEEGASTIKKEEEPIKSKVTFVDYDDNGDDDDDNGDDDVFDIPLFPFDHTSSLTSQHVSSFSSSAFDGKQQSESSATKTSLQLSESVSRAITVAKLAIAQQTLHRLEIESSMSDTELSSSSSSASQQGTTTTAQQATEGNGDLLIQKERLLRDVEIEDHIRMEKILSFFFTNLCELVSSGDKWCGGFYYNYRYSDAHHQRDHRAYLSNHIDRGDGSKKQEGLLRGVPLTPPCPHPSLWVEGVSTILLHFAASIPTPTALHERGHRCSHQNGKRNGNGDGFNRNMVIEENVMLASHLSTAQRLLRDLLKSTSLGSYAAAAAPTSPVILSEIAAKVAFNEKSSSRSMDEINSEIIEKRLQLFEKKKKKLFEQVATAPTAGLVVEESRRQSGGGEKETFNNSSTLECIAASFVFPTEGLTSEEDKKEQTSKNNENVLLLQPTRPGDHSEELHPRRRQTEGPGLLLSPAADDAPTRATGAITTNLISSLSTHATRDNNKQRPNRSTSTLSLLVSDYPMPMPNPSELRPRPHPPPPPQCDEPSASSNVNAAYSCRAHPETKCHICRERVGAYLPRCPVAIEKDTAQVIVFIDDIGLWITVPPPPQRVLAVLENALLKPSSVVSIKKGRRRKNKKGMREELNLSPYYSSLQANVATVAGGDGMGNKYELGHQQTIDSYDDRVGQGGVNDSNNGLDALTDRELIYNSPTAPHPSAPLQRSKTTNTTSAQVSSPSPSLLINRRRARLPLPKDRNLTQTRALPLVYEDQLHVETETVDEGEEEEEEEERSVAMAAIARVRQLTGKGKDRRKEAETEENGGVLENDRQSHYEEETEKDHLFARKKRSDLAFAQHQLYVQQQQQQQRVAVIEAGDLLSAFFDPYFGQKNIDDDESDDDNVVGGRNDSVLPLPRLVWLSKEREQYLSSLSFGIATAYPEEERYRVVRYTEDMENNKNGLRTAAASASAADDMCYRHRLRHDTNDTVPNLPKQSCGTCAFRLKEQLFLSWARQPLVEACRTQCDECGPNKSNGSGGEDVGGIERNPPLSLPSSSRPQRSANSSPEKSGVEKGTKKNSCQKDGERTNTTSVYEGDIIHFSLSLSSSDHKEEEEKEEDRHNNRLGLDQNLQSSSKKGKEEEEMKWYTYDGLFTAAPSVVFSSSLLHTEEQSNNNNNNNNNNNKGRDDDDGHSTIERNPMSLMLISKIRFRSLFLTPSSSPSPRALGNTKHNTNTKRTEAGAPYHETSCSLLNGTPTPREPTELFVVYHYSPNTFLNRGDDNNNKDLLFHFCCSTHCYWGSHFTAGSENSRGRGGTSEVPPLQKHTAISCPLLLPTASSSFLLGHLRTPLYCEKKNEIPVCHDSPISGEHKNAIGDQYPAVHYYEQAEKEGCGANNALCKVPNGNDEIVEIKKQRFFSEKMRLRVAAFEGWKRAMSTALSDLQHQHNHQRPFFADD